MKKLALLFIGFGIVCSIDAGRKKEKESSYVSFNELVENKEEKKNTVVFLTHEAFHAIERLQFTRFSDALEREKKRYTGFQDHYTQPDEKQELITQYKSMLSTVFSKIKEKQSTSDIRQIIRLSQDHNHMRLLFGFSSLGAFSILMAQNNIHYKCYPQWSTTAFNALYFVTIMSLLSTGTILACCNRYNTKRSQVTVGERLLAMHALTQQYHDAANNNDFTANIEPVD